MRQEQTCSTNTKTASVLSKILAQGAFGRFPLAQIRVKSMLLFACPCRQSPNSSAFRRGNTEFQPRLLPLLLLVLLAPGDLLSPSSHWA